MPSNARATVDGSLFIYQFDRSNLGIYTCTANTNRRRISQSIDFQLEQIFPQPSESPLSIQIYSSRAEYRFGGRFLAQCISTGTLCRFFSEKKMNPILDPNITPQWIRYRTNLTETLSSSFLLISKINRMDLGRYECASLESDPPSSIRLDIKRYDLLSRRFPSNFTSNIQIEFLSLTNQLKLGGSILIKCASSDKSPVRWLVDQKSSESLKINQSLMSFSKFSPIDFNYYRCTDERTEKTLVLSPAIFDTVKQIYTPKPILSKYNRSFIEILRGKYVGDNLTLICRIGQGDSSSSHILQFFHRTFVLSFQMSHKAK